MTTPQFDELAAEPGPPCGDGGDPHNWADLGFQPDPLHPDKRVYLIRCGTCGRDRYRLL